MLFLVRMLTTTIPVTAELGKIKLDSLESDTLELIETKEEIKLVY